MTTREEALSFGLSFPDTYQDEPFHDPNWQLVRVKGSKKAFLWTYEREGYINPMADQFFIPLPVSAGGMRKNVFAR